MISPTVGQPGEPAGPPRHSSGESSQSCEPNQANKHETDSPPRILFLDDDPARAEDFLIDNPHAVWVQTVTECVDRLKEGWDEVHLDHDLGGQTFVDSSVPDCGMEVIRWLCGNRREHLRDARFFIHTHNMLAGMLMVLQMRQSGYVAEFRPFGHDPILFLRHDEDEQSLAAERPPEVEAPTEPQATGIVDRLLCLLTRRWRRPTC